MCSGNDTAHHCEVFRLYGFISLLKTKIHYFYSELASQDIMHNEIRFIICNSRNNSYYRTIEAVVRFCLRQ